MWKVSFAPHRLALKRIKLWETLVHWEQTDWLGGSAFRQLQVSWESLTSGVKRLSQGSWCALAVSPCNRWQITDKEWMRQWSQVKGVW